MYGKTEAQNSSIICPQSHQWGAAKPELQAVWFQSLCNASPCPGFVCNMASVALGAAMQFPHMSMTDQNKLMLHWGRKSALRVELLAGKRHTEAATSPLTCLLLSQLSTTSTLPSLLPGTLSPALCGLRMLLRTHEFLADSGSLHLVSPQSPSFHPNRNTSPSEGGTYVLVRIFLIPLSPSFHYWSPTSAMLC